MSGFEIRGGLGFVFQFVVEKLSITLSCVVKYKYKLFSQFYLEQYRFRYSDNALNLSK